MTTERLADWHDFLRIRHELIHRWIGEGKTPAYVVDTLAMDPMQVTLIAMTPLGPRQSDPRWSAGTEAPSADIGRRWAVRIVAHARLDGVVSADDGETAIAATADALLAWFTTIDLQPGDEVLIVRER